jgi:SynChlorMet cassette protein ScmD
MASNGEILRLAAGIIFPIILQENRMTPSQKPMANPVVVLREEFDDWAVLFNPDTAEAVGINPVGIAVWKLMDGRQTVGEITLKIQEQFSRVPGTAPAEVDKFVSDLEKRGFIGYESDRTG